MPKINCQNEQCDRNGGNLEKLYSDYTSCIGDFEVADSSCRFCGIGHFLGESAIFWRIS